MAFRVQNKKDSRCGMIDSTQLQAEIQKRAYEIFQKRGCKPGNDLANWLEAERQIKRELRIK